MVETIGEALDLGWALKARCAFGKHEGLKTVRACSWSYDLDMVTLVATRGRDFPLARIAERLRCPRCGSRRMAVMFPAIEAAAAGDAYEVEQSVVAAQRGVARCGSRP